jgi:DNA polymerase-3 subunit epsilon
MSWNAQPLASWDTETSGLDIETDRIVTSALVHYTPGSEPVIRTWLSDADGIEIPKDASDLHKVTTEHAREHGRPAAEVIEEISAALALKLAAGMPLVVFNARYDLSLLDRECRRHGLLTLEERLGAPVGPVIDPLIIDKAADKFRGGSRKLTALAAHYGVTLTDAHTADADALAAVQVAVALAEKYPQLQVDADRLHEWQIGWAAGQAKSFRAYREGRGEPIGDIREEWPLVPYRKPASIPHQPHRGDAVEAWLKQQRDRHLDDYQAPPPEWHALDALLDAYRLHADTSTPLHEHVPQPAQVHPF